MRGVFVSTLPLRPGCIQQEIFNFCVLARGCGVWSIRRCAVTSYVAVASTWVGMRVFLLRWILVHMRSFAGEEMKCEHIYTLVTRRYVRSSVTVRLLCQENGWRFSFHSTTLGRPYPTEDIEFLRLVACLRSLLHPEVRNYGLRRGGVESGRYERFPPPVNHGPDARLRWGGEVQY